MKAIFSAHDVWEIVENGYDASQDISALTQAQKDQFNCTKKKDQKAISLIHQALDEVTFKKVSNARTPKQLWEMLQAACKGKDKAKKFESRFYNQNFLWMIENKKEARVKEDDVEAMDAVVVEDLEEEEEVPQNTNQSKDENSQFTSSRDHGRGGSKPYQKRFGNNDVKANFSQDGDKEVNEEVETTLLLASKEMKNEEKHAW
ncbi:hypothetical protein SLEP1_g27071 [Rubroshorea leprosula]|uniref:Uncharacterized protein n=1 Tax=Rubroshorea leprosula TaxID=152421 RepID=A0AAV5JPE5_9ROSI|nr:hypothetical protein SLEP1_g27071 [Rubroshorea leprosula]